MALNINKLSDKNSYADYQVKNTGNIPIYMTSKGLDSDKFDKSCDGKFSLSQALKNFGKGLVSPITSMFSSTKNFLVGTGMIVGSLALVAATGGAAAPILIAAGVGMGALQAGKAVCKIATARNGDDVEKAFYDIGGATSTIGLSVVGAKSALKQANIESEGLNLLNSTKKCITSFKSLAQESIDVFKSGHYKINFSNALKIATQPEILKKYSKDIYNECAKDFGTSFDALKNVLPEEFKSSLKGRYKCKISIYEKIVKERTTLIDEKIKKIKNCSDFSDEIKQEKINGLLEERKQIKTDEKFAKSKVGDLLGARLVIDDVSPKNIEKLVSALTEATENGDIKLTEIENYRGVNEKYKGENQFYFSEAHIEKLRKASGTAEVRNASKSLGYTAVQMKVQPKNGKVIELQIRGKHVDEFADVEHIPYDLRQGKDISKGNNKIGILLANVQKIIRNLSEDQYKQYQEYIYNNYIYAQAKELGKTVEKPTLPECIDSKLSVENLHILHENTKELPSGTIKNPLCLYSQLPIIASGENSLSQD